VLNNAHSLIVTYIFIPLCNWFPSPKTKYRHLSLSLVSPSVSLLLPILRVTPSIHLSSGLPFPRAPSCSHCRSVRGSLTFWYSFYVSKPLQSVYSVTSNTFLPLSIADPVWCHFNSFVTSVLCGSSPKLQLPYVPQGDKTCTRVKLLIFRVISGFRREVDGNCPLKRY
jgi:hypothetical protein